MKDIKKFLISGGGTGGHIFPALSIANALKKIEPDCEILFVGAEGKMEMEKVPAAGYEIVGLPVRGLIRKLTLTNFVILYKLLVSMRKSKKIIRSFKPDVVIGVGGFASGPVLKQAQKMGIPTLIQEQNSYAGVTNKLLAKKARKICVAYDNMERFFPKEVILKTGNPVRQTILENIETKKTEAYQYFGLKPDKKIVLVLGGSLGARTINESIHKDLSKFEEAGLQLIWQTGKFYYPKVENLNETLNPKGIVVTDFITRMDLAYAIADVVISRAGASTVSELGLICKPVIFVPSPNVAEDHQTKNAMALIEKDAAMMIEDRHAQEQLVSAVVQLTKDDARMMTYTQNIASVGIKDSANIIAKEVLKLC